MDRDFIARIYEEYYELVKTIITYSIHTLDYDDITSCVQDVFLIAMQKEDLPSHKSPKAWLLVTSKNIAKTFNRNRIIRNKHITLYDDVENFELTQVDCADLVIDKINEQRFKSLDINKAIMELLSFNEREFYTLLYQKKMSIKEISKELNISNGAAATRHTRLKEKIRKIIEKL